MTLSPSGAGGVKDKSEMSRSCSFSPRSIASYFEGLCASAVTVNWPSPSSAIAITRKSCASTWVELTTQIASARGASVNASVGCKTRPVFEPIVRVSICPLGSITESVQPPSDRSMSASIVMAVNVALATRPPSRSPPRTGSATLMMCPGLATAPSSPVLKVTVSDSLRSEYKSHRPTRLACPRLVQPKAVTCV